jgi:hypothetical protein
MELPPAKAASRVRFAEYSTVKYIEMVKSQVYQSFELRDGEKGCPRRHQVWEDRKELRPDERVLTKQDDGGQRCVRIKKKTGLAERFERKCSAFQRPTWRPPKNAEMEEVARRIHLRHVKAFEEKEAEFFAETNEESKPHNFRQWELFYSVCPETPIERKVCFSKCVTQIPSNEPTMAEPPTVARAKSHAVARAEPTIPTARVNTRDHTRKTTAKRKAAPSSLRRSSRLAAKRPVQYY